MFISSFFITVLNIVHILQVHQASYKYEKQVYASMILKSKTDTNFPNFDAIIMQLPQC